MHTLDSVKSTEYLNHICEAFRAFDLSPSGSGNVRYFTSRCFALHFQINVDEVNGCVYQQLAFRAHFKEGVSADDQLKVCASILHRHDKFSLKGSMKKAGVMGVDGSKLFLDNLLIASTQFKPENILSLIQNFIYQFGDKLIELEK